MTNRRDVACAAVLVAMGDPDDALWALAVGGDVDLFGARWRGLERRLRQAANDMAGLTAAGASGRRPVVDGAEKLVTGG
jgi:hypothetical protein